METIEAGQDTVAEGLAVGLKVVDAARRVGWAKAFEALERIEGLEEEVRQAREQADLLRRGYSRLVGLVQGLEISRSESLDAELARHYAVVRTFRCRGAFDQGLNVGHEHYLARLNAECPGDGDRKAARQAIRAERLAELRQAANDKGHRIKFVLGRALTCSCGEAMTADTEKDFYAWRHNHDAMAVHGVSFDDLKAAWKRADA